MNAADAAQELQNFLEDLQLYGEHVNIEVNSELASLLYSVPPNTRYDIIRKMNYYGSTILHDAAYQGQREFVKALLYSVPPELRERLLLQHNTFTSPVLNRAALNGHYATVEAIIGSMRECNKFRIMTTICPWSYGSPLHCAAYRGSLDTIDRLLAVLPRHQQNMYLRTTNTHGETALDIAAKHGKLRSVEHLKQKYIELESEYGLVIQKCHNIEVEVSQITQRLDSCSVVEYTSNPTVLHSPLDRDDDGNEDVFEAEEE